MKMPANSTEKGRIKVSQVVIPALCTVFFCRRYFSEGVSESIDSGWIWALNHAIHEGSVFGREFVFTYGPLGFLSTRYTQYIGVWPLLLGDIVLAAGFFYFVFRKAALFIPGILVMLAAVIVLRNAYYAQAVFVLFFIYMSLIYTDRKQDRANLVFAALYSVMLFFVKANYSVVVPVFLLAAVGKLVAGREWRSLMWLVEPVAVLFAGILLVFRVNIPGYVYNGLSLISGYEEAMFLPVDVHSPDYNVMTVFVAIAFGLPVGYAFRLAKKKIITAGHILFICLFCAAVFLTYKNGVTRFDALHIEQFMALFPFLLLSAVIVAGEYQRPVLLVIIAGVVVTSFSCTVRKGSGLGAMAEEVWSLTSVHGYYSTVLKPSGQHFPGRLLLSGNKKRKIAAATVDVIPHEIYVVAANDLNYRGRPVCQSYTVYKPGLDRLNAKFFLGANRPQKVMISGNVADVGCYRGFYEPLTHATIQLNYDYEMTTLPNDSVPVNNNDYFLVLQQRRAAALQPKFTLIDRGNFRINDTIDVPAGGNPIYMTADIRYTLAGKLNKLLLQPMPVTITLYMEDGQYYDYRLQLPMLESPVPVSRLITSNRELWYFLSGRERQARKIKAFKVGTHNREIEPDIRIAFYSFDNYRRAPDSSNTQSANPGQPAVLPGLGSLRP